MRALVRGWFVVMLFGNVTWIQAQNPVLAKDEKQELPPSLAIKISDEPRAIDAATLVPKKLAATATVRFDDKTLRDVVDWFKTTQKLELQVDTRDLAEADILLSEQITEGLNNEPVFFLLNRLSAIGIGWYEEDEILHLTSKTAAENHEHTVSYILSDLFDTGYEGGDDLISVLQSTVQPSTWKANGGQGSAVVLGDVLFVRQTGAVHLEIAGLLAALKTHGRRTFIMDSPIHTKLRELLEAPATVKIRDLPLTAAVAELARAAKCEMRLDLKALREATIRERMPVSIDAADQKLRHVLRGMLAELKLTWIIRDGALWITTPTAAERDLRTAVYDVRDLCLDYGETEALASTIQEQSSPTTWKANGGQSDLAFAKPGVMVVMQTEEQHDEVLRLLENYRTALRTSKPRQRDSKNFEPSKVFYRIPQAMASELQKFIPAEIKPKTWKSADPKAVGTIVMLPSLPELRDSKGATVTDDSKTDAKNLLVIPQAVLIINQTEDVHQEIGILISNIERGTSHQRGDVLGGGLGGFGGGFLSVPVE